MSRRRFLESVALSLGLTFGVVRGAESAVITFDMTLQPGVSNSYVIGPSSLNRAFVSEVTPIADGFYTGQTILTNTIRPEYISGDWYDVLRLEIAASDPPFDVNVRLYEASASLPVATSFTTTLSGGVAHGFSLGPSLFSTTGHIIEISPTGNTAGGPTIQASLVQPEFDGLQWNDVLRIQTLPTDGPHEVAVRVQETTGLPVVYTNSFTLSPGTLHSFILGPSSQLRGLVSNIGPSSAGSGGQTLQTHVIRPEFNGTLWNDVLRLQILPTDPPLDVHIVVYAYDVTSPADLGDHDETSENFRITGIDPSGPFSNWSVVNMTPGEVPNSVTGDHLVISEVAPRGAGTGAASDSSEYIELFNPTALPVSLDDYYISDDLSYYLTVNGPYALSSTDFTLRFPPGRILGPSQTLLLCVTKAGFQGSGATSGSAAHFLEMGNSNGDTSDDMIPIGTGSTFPVTGGMMTNPGATNGEWVALYRWNGNSDRVCDVDYASWGSTSATNPKLSKTGILVEGPDTDFFNSVYAFDTPEASQTNLGNGSALTKPNTYQRQGAEAGETTTAGNGCSTELPTISHQYVGAFINEGDAGSQPLDFQLYLSARNPNPVTVTLETVDGSAVAPDDYTAIAPTPVVFDPGIVRRTISVAVQGETVVEPDESFDLVLSSPVNATLTNPTMELTIVNDDSPPPTMNIADASIVEGNTGFSSLFFQVTLSDPSLNLISANFGTVNGTATAPADFTLGTGSVAFLPGEVSKTVSVQIRGDTSFEPDQTFTVLLGSPQNAVLGDAVATGTILNDDGPPTIIVFNVSVLEGQDDPLTGQERTTPIVVELALTPQSEVVASVEYETMDGTALVADDDYAAATGTTTFVPNATTTTILNTKFTVYANGDFTNESDETFSIQLSSPVNAILGVSTLTVTLRNDDGIISPIYQVNDSLIVTDHKFDAAAGGCLPSGWVGEDLSGIVFAHVDTRHLLNGVSLFDGSVINMGTRALWVGADMTSHPGHVQHWVHNYGYGDGWSQRLVSPPVDLTAHPNLVLSYEAQIEIKTSGGLVNGISAVANEFVAVQAQRLDGSWAFLNSRYITPTANYLAFRAITGRGIYRCEVHFNADGNDTLNLAPTTPLRIVTQTSISISNEEGTAPLGVGAAEIDNVTVRDGAVDVLAPLDFEDGTTGAWTTTAVNGYWPSIVASFTRDVPSTNTLPDVRAGYDANDRTCVWSFPSPGDTLASGTFARLTSPWFRLYAADGSFALHFTMKFNVLSQRRFIQFRARRSNGGRPLVVNRPGGVYYTDGTTDDDSGLFEGIEHSSEMGVPAGGGYAYAQVVIYILDRGEQVGGHPNGLNGRPTTRLPFFDELRITQTGVDADFDGVPDVEDECPSEAAAGQDADGDGCTDPTATLRHPETWPAGDAVRYRVSASGDPRIADGSDLAAIHAGFARWHAAAGVSLPITDGPDTSQTESSAFDGVNLITFEDTHFGLPPAVLAVTPTLSYTRRQSYDEQIRLPGQILDSDMIFNRSAAFSTPTHDAGSNAVDLESVVVHEAGHFLGLSHSGVLDASMFFILQNGTLARSLETDDEAAIAAAYPGPSFAADYGTITGRVTRGGTGGPVPGAMVAAVHIVGGAEADTVASDYTDEDGDYALRRLPAGDYAVRLTPLDGNVGGYPLTPSYISARVQALAVSNFEAEWWDAAEGPSDDVAARTLLTVAATGVHASIDLVTNIDVTPPQVASISPANDTTEVRVDALVVVSFSEGVSAGSLQSAFHVRNLNTNTGVGGSGALISAGRSFVFTPDPPLQFNTTYELRIDGTLVDRQGVPIAAPFTAQFTTQTQPVIAIADLQPRTVTEGSILTLLGAGFGTDPGDQNEVQFTFCGTCTPVAALGSNVTPTSMSVRVPTGAVSGPVTVTLDGSTSNGFALIIQPASPLVAPSPSGVFALPAGFAPWDVAFAPDALTLYAVGDGGFATINLDPERPDFRIARVANTGASRALALSADGFRAYVTRPTVGNVIVVDANPSSGTFRQVQATIGLGEEAAPSGIAITPSGRRAYATGELEGVLYELDTDPNSALRHQLVREIREPELALSGGIVVAPRSDAVLFTTENGGCRSISTAGGSSTSLNAERSAGGVAVAPSGLEALFAAGGTTGGSLLFAPLEVGGPAPGAIAIGGIVRDVAVSPLSQSAYIVNQAFNALQVIDVNPASAGYHALVAEVSTQEIPVAVAVSPGGDLIAVANQGGNSVSLYGVGSSGEVVRVVPATVIPGTQAAVQFSAGFDPTGVRIDLGSGPFPAPRTVATAPAASFEVPAVTQQSAGLSALEPDDRRTLLVTVPVVDPIASFAPQSTGLGFDPVPGMCVGQDYVGELSVVRVSHDGRLVAVARRLPCQVLLDLYRASDQGSAPWGTLVATATLSTSSETWVDMDFSADGRKLWCTVGLADLREVDVDPASPTLGQVTTIPLAPTQIPRAIRSDPLGRFMVVAEEPGTLNVWNVATRTSVGSVALGAGGIAALAITPGGSHALVGRYGAATFVDLDAQTVVVTTPAHGSTPTEAVHSIAVSRDGRRAVGAFVSGDLAVWSTDIGVAPLGTELYFGNPMPAGAEISALIPAAEPRAVIGGCVACTDAFRLDPGSLPLTPVVAPIGIRSRALEASADGRRLLVADWDGSALTGRVALFLRADATRMSLVSGAAQTGLPGTTLPRAARVRVTDDDERPQAGVVLEFLLTSGLGSLDGNGPRALRLSDTNGEAEVQWTLPAASGTEVLTITALGVPGAQVTVSAEVAGDDSQIVPEVVEIGPSDGATNVNTGTPAYVRFNQSMNEASVRQHVQLFANLVAQPLVVRFLDEGRTVVAQPYAPIPFGAACSLVVLPGALDTDLQATTTHAFVRFTVQPRPPLALSYTSPPSAHAGAPVVLVGDGFSPIGAQNTVLIGGKIAAVTAATSSELTVNVPSGLTSGSYSVTVSTGGATSNAISFTVPRVPEGTVPIADIKVGKGARELEIAPDGLTAYVTNPENNTVTVLQLSPPALLRNVSVGLRPLGITILPDHSAAYVANSGSGDVSVIDAQPGSPTYNQVIETIPVTGGQPVDIAYSPLGPEIIVLHQDDAGTVDIIDADAGSGAYHQVVASTNAGSSGQGIAIDPDGTRQFVLTPAGNLIQIDLRSRAVVSSTNVGSGGQGIAIDPDGGLLYVLFGEGQLKVVDITPGSATENQVISSTNVGSSGQGIAISPDGGLLFVTSGQELVPVAVSKAGGSEDASIVPGAAVTLNPLPAVPTGGYPTAIAVAPDGRSLLVVNTGTGEVIKLEPATELPPLVAELEFAPGTLNPSSNGAWVTGYIEISPPDLPSQIVRATVLLNGTVPMDSAASLITDRDFDGVPELAAVFSRREVARTLTPGDAVEITVTGRIGNRDLIARDTIRVLDVKKKGQTGVAANAPPESGVELTWDTPESAIVRGVTILVSLDDGRSWNLEAANLANHGRYLWRPKAAENDTALITVLLVESVDRDGNPVTGIAGMIEVPVAEYVSVVGPPGELSLVLPNPARGSLRLSFGLPAAADVRLEVLDVQGRHVHELTRGSREAGWHELTWEGRGRTGVKVAPGVYFVRLSAGGREVHRRTVWLN